MIEFKAVSLRRQEARRVRRNAWAYTWAVLLVIALCVALLLASAPPTSAAAAAKGLVTVNLSEVVRSVFYAPQYVAITKGFFEDEGLKIELSTAQGAAALLSGTVDIGFFGPEAAI